MPKAAATSAYVVAVSSIVSWSSAQPIARSGSSTGSTAMAAITSAATEVTWTMYGSCESVTTCPRWRVAVKRRVAT